MLVLSGWRCHDAALAVLGEFGGIRAGAIWHGIPGPTRYLIEFNAELRRIDDQYLLKPEGVANRLDRFRETFGEECYPIGVAEWGHAFLFVKPTGEIWCKGLDGDIGKFAHNIDEALEKILIRDQSGFSDFLRLFKFKR
jgi:hypothetical protein